MAEIAELRELEDEELHGRLADYRRELLNLRFQLATGQLDDQSRLGQVRKDVARVLTLLRDREIALAEGRDAGPVPRPVREGPAAEERPARRRSRAAATAEAEEDEVTAEADDELEAGDDAPGAEEDE